MGAACPWRIADNVDLLDAPEQRCTGGCHQSLAGTAFLAQQGIALVMLAAWINRCLSGISPG